MRVVEIGTSRIAVLPVVRGLVSEAEAVSRAFVQMAPDAVAVSISREELDALRVRDDLDLYDPSDLEIVYQAILERFGEVRIPPPAFVSALEVAERAGTTIIPLDMNDELYTETYCDKVSTLDMVRESFFSRRATSKRYDLSSAQAFAVSWDRMVNRSGFRDLEQAREAHMAGVLRKLGGRYGNILAVIECERCEGIVKLLQSNAFSLDRPRSDGLVP
jgi:pheromone shutdown protein TraB